MGENKDKLMCSEMSHSAIQLQWPTRMLKIAPANTNKRLRYKSGNFVLINDTWPHDIQWHIKGLLHGYEWGLRFGGLELRFG